MRCQPVACLWHGGAPSLHHHRITACAVLNQPPTIYTGGSDGSIIWWNLSAQNQHHLSNQEIWPVALLCGHAAAIAGLEICMPLACPAKIESPSSIKLTPTVSDALVSVCVDGVLCVWSRSSGHCRCRRKLPPWVGIPSMLSVLPSSRRYVCIASNCIDSVQASSHHAAETADMKSPRLIQNEVITDKDTHHRRASKCAVVIVDSCTLTLVQTVFHGNLSIGSLDFMAVVPSLEGEKKQVAVIANSFGKLQAIPILEPNPNSEAGTGLPRSSSYVGTYIGADSLQHDGLQAVSVAASGKLLALVFRNHCTFKSMTSGTAIGEVSLADSLLCSKGSCIQACLIGGMFLQFENSGGELDALDPAEGYLENFAVWSNTGAAIIYRISVSGVTLNYEPWCEIPSASNPYSFKMSISFCQLNQYLLRLESLYFEANSSPLWKPHISIWSLYQPSATQFEEHGKLTMKKSDNAGHPFLCMMLGAGGFLGDWIGRSCSISEIEALRHDACLKATKEDTDKSSSASSTNFDVFCGEHGNNFMLKGCIVSSSLVLSEYFYAPRAVVYGFYSGEIEVVQFDGPVQGLNSIDGSLHHNINPHISKRSFSGHTGTVLCLAAHCLTATLSELCSKWVLVSGSADCTIHIWDLDTGSLISVMHHHVAPIRQIILPPPQTDRPWSDCFLSVGEDFCVTLTSLETLRVERIFPGHPSYPKTVVWDGVRGYIACLCRNSSASSDAVDVLYLWDVKTGARERVLRGNASHSMFDHFCRGINVNSITGNILGGTTSASSLTLSAIEDANFSQSHVTDFEKGSYSSPAHGSKGQKQTSKMAHDFSSYAADHNSKEEAPSHPVQWHRHLIKSSCPFPGIATLIFDLSSLMHPCRRYQQFVSNGGMQENIHVLEKHLEKPKFPPKDSNDSCIEGSRSHLIEEHAWDKLLEERLHRLSLSWLHLWDVDQELDKLLTNEMNVCKPESFVVASGFQGDKGSLTLAFPDPRATLELWRSSSEFCAVRSLAMVSLAQRMNNLFHSSSAASSALAAFYTRNFAEKVPDIKPPLLQLLVSFWQDPSEHMRMAARSLFHCAAARSVPLPLRGPKIIRHALQSSHVNDVGVNVCTSMDETSAGSFLDHDGVSVMQRAHQDDEYSMLAWLESFELQDWISCIGGTSQDAIASHIIVAAALAVWYPSLVRQGLASLVVHPLMKLVMAMSDGYSSIAAELLAEGMESTWKACIGPEIPRLIGDVFFQIECVSGASANNAMQKPSLAITVQETLVGILLPSLAMADIIGFLNVIESQTWSTASDSPVHLVSLMTLIRIVRASPKSLSLHLDKAVNFILQTMDHGNSVMRRACLQSSMAALREFIRVFPMISLNDVSTRLAVGDAIGDIRNATIRIYDMQSVTKVKVLDASGPPGLPSLLGRASDMMITTVISALGFSPDGEGLVAFSEHGLMIRWWSLGTGWWEKLSRSIVPVQCTKLIFVPPWEGFSSNCSRSSIMASITGHDSPVTSPGKTRGLGEVDSLKLLIHNLDLHYRLEWLDERKVMLKRHGHELGSCQL